MRQVIERQMRCYMERKHSGGGGYVPPVEWRGSTRGAWSKGAREVVPLQGCTSVSRERRSRDGGGYEGALADGA